MSYQDQLGEEQGVLENHVVLFDIISKRKNTLMGMMPQLLQKDFGRFVRMAVEAYRKDANLHKCTPESVYNALQDSFQLGLNPVTKALGEAYLVPYNEGHGRNRVKVATFQVGYRGMTKLAMESDMVGRVSAGLIFPDDIVKGCFHADQATGEIRHTWDPSVDRSNEEEIVAAYACCWLKDQELPVVRILHRSEIEGRRARSQAYQRAEKSWDGKDPKRNSPWHKDFGAMARKSALRALFSMGVIPLSPNAMKAMHHDEAVEVGDDEEVVKAAEATVVVEDRESIEINGEVVYRDMVSDEEWQKALKTKEEQ